MSRISVEIAPGGKNWPISPHGPGRNSLGELVPEIGLAKNMNSSAATGMPGVRSRVTRPATVADIAAKASPTASQVSSNSRWNTSSSGPPRAVTAKPASTP